MPVFELCKFFGQEYYNGIAFPFSRCSSWPRDQTQVFHIASRFFTIWAIRQAPRILDWVAIPSSRGSSWPSARTWVSYIASIFSTSETPRKPLKTASYSIYSWDLLGSQWLRICLARQRTQVWSLVREDTSCLGATKPKSCNYWAHTRKARALQ